MTEPNGNVQPMLPYSIRGQFIKDLSFESPNPIKTFSEQTDEQPNINVDIQARGENIGGADFEVTLEIKAHAKRNDENIFMVELVYAAFVTFDESVNRDNVGRLLMVEVPHMMFPAARNIIADITRDGGFPPLMLNPVNFEQLFEQQAANQPQANA